MKYVYKSATGRSISIDNYNITVEPGLTFREAVPILDTYIGTTINRYTNGVLDTVDDVVAAEIPPGHAALTLNTVTGLLPAWVQNAIAGVSSAANLGIFVNTATLETAYPAANNPGQVAFVGASWAVAVPYDVSSGVWIKRSTTDVKEEGTSVNATATKLNFIGSRVTATQNGGDANQVDVTITGGTDVKEEGTSVNATATKLNFIGAGVTATQNGGDANQVDVTVTIAAPISISSNTTLVLATHSERNLRVATGVALTVADLGSTLNCIIEVDVGGSITIVSSGGLKITDATSSAGTTSTRTRTQASNPSGFVLKGTSTTGTYSLSGV